jgi:Protein of unknown function (DUF1254)
VPELLRLLFSLSVLLIFLMFVLSVGRACSAAGKFSLVIVGDRVDAAGLLDAPSPFAWGIILPLFQKRRVLAALYAEAVLLLRFRYKISLPKYEAFPEGLCSVRLGAVGKINSTKSDALKTKTMTLLVLASLLTLRTATHAQSVSTRSGKLDFELGLPTKETVTKLYDEMDFQRACQLYLWALPLVEFGNLQVILEGTTGAMPGDLTIYLGNEQSVFLTPNATTPYIFAYLDLAKTGPVVMDIPAGGIAGSSLGCLAASPSATWV